MTPMENHERYLRYVDDRDHEGDEQVDGLTVSVLVALVATALVVAIVAAALAIHAAWSWW